MRAAYLIFTILFIETFLTVEAHAQTQCLDVSQDGATRCFPETYTPPIMLRPWSSAETDCLSLFDAVVPGFATTESGVGIHHPAFGLCENAKEESALGLVNCFNTEFRKTGEWRWAALGCATAGATEGASYFPETYCMGPTAPSGCYVINEYIAIYPELDPLERECSNLILTSGPAAAAGERLAKKHSIFTLCKDTPNPYSTVRCFSQEYAKVAEMQINAAGSDADLDIAVDAAVDRCRLIARQGFGDRIPSLDPTPIGICQRTTENILQAFLSNVTVLGSGCDGATVCGAVAEADPSQIMQWVNTGGAVGFAQNIGDDPKGFLWETLGCAAELGLGEAQRQAGLGKRVRLADLCAFSPDQLAKTITASVACGNVHVRDGNLAAGCAAGSTRGHDFFDRLKRIIFVPGEPQCLVCPTGKRPAANKWAHLEGTPQCYAPCPAGAAERFFTPSMCSDGTKRQSAPATVTSKTACPAGQFAASRIFSEDTFCMSGCDGLALGKTCFGVKVNADAARAALAGLKRR